MAEPRPPLVATYSICACDLETGQWGVATQSKFLAVGSVVPWAAPHVGAIATQAYANPRYGPAGLELLRAGASADEVVEQLTAADDDRAQRQLGVVDARRPRSDVHRVRVPRLGRRAGRRRLRGAGEHPRLGRDGRRDGRRVRGHRRATARRAPDRLPRRGPGRGRRPPRPAVRGAARRRAGRRLRRPVRRPRRPPHRRPRASRRGAAPPLSPPSRALREDAARGLAPGRRRAPRRDRASGSPGSDTRRSTTGPASRTSRSGSTAPTASIPSCSRL